MTAGATPAPVPDATPDAVPPPEPEGRSGRLELFAAILLGVAATLTAFSAYKAALLDGDALQGYTKSTRILNNANSFYAEANQIFAADQQLFIQWTSAAKSGDTELAGYLKDDVMRPELSKAIDWVIKTDEARTPFDDMEGNPYTVDSAIEAERQEKQASKVFKAAAADDDNGDQYELASVLLAITLFFGGIATLFRRRAASVTLLGVGTATLVAGAVEVVIALGG